MRSIAKRLDEFHVFYLTGVPKKEWSEINFHKFKMKKAFNKILSIQLSKKKFYNATKKINPDIYYALADSWQQEYMRYCASKSGKPFVIRLRGNYKEIEKAIKSNFIIRYLRNYLREKSIKEADLIIPVSQDLKEKALSWNLNTKISYVIPSGVDFINFKPDKKKTNVFTIGYAGRLDYDKGADILLKIIEKTQNTNFLIAGRNIANISFPKNVKYLGRISHTKMPDFYNSIDALLMPSRTEGMSLSMLESYACQTPVITSKKTYPKELPIYGILCNPTIEEYVNAIEKIKDISPIDIRSQIKEYSWESFGNKVVTLFETLMREHMTLASSRELSNIGPSPL